MQRLVPVVLLLPYTHQMVPALSALQAVPPAGTSVDDVFPRQAKIPPPPIAAVHCSLPTVDDVMYQVRVALSVFFLLSATPVVGFVAPVVEQFLVAEIDVWVRV